MTIAKPYKILLCLCVLICGHGRDAWSYNCANPQFRNKDCRVAYSYAHSDVIFLGQLLNVNARKADSGATLHTSEFFIKESYLGHVTGQIKIQSEDATRPPSKIGGHYIVFALEVGYGIHIINPCSEFKIEAIDTPLVDTPLQVELRRIAASPAWKFQSDACLIQQKTILKDPKGSTRKADGVYDSRNKKD